MSCESFASTMLSGAETGHDTDAYVSDRCARNEVMLRKVRLSARTPNHLVPAREGEKCGVE